MSEEWCLLKFVNDPSNTRASDHVCLVKKRELKSRNITVCYESGGKTTNSSNLPQWNGHRWTKRAGRSTLYSLPVDRDQNFTTSERRIANATATYCDAVEDQSGGATGYPWQCRGYADFVITTCDHSSFNALEAPCARSEAETRRLMRLRRGCGYNDI